MKTTLAITTAAFVTLAPSSRALPPEVQETHQRAFNVVKEIRDTLVPAPIVKFVEAFPPIAEPRRVVLQLAQVNPTATPAPPPGVPGVMPGQDGEAIAAWANDFALATTRGALGGIFGDGSKAAKRPVVVGADAKNIPAIEEDLNVMLRIVEKAAGTRDEKEKAMGIDVSIFGGSSSTPRTFYLDGYGAMFLVKVRYPLLGPAKPEEAQTNNPTSSDWERARQEVYGVKLQDAHNLYVGGGEQFDEQRVETLKTQLIEDLSNATHIRHLKADDWVTVVVFGGSRGGTHSQQVRAVAGRAGGGGGYGVATRSESGAQTTMTLRAKKSDVDAFAKGKMKSEEFRKKVSVQVY